MIHDLSICIPTYNRTYHLENCLNSIKLESLKTKHFFDVCISDNNSTENITPLIEKYSSFFKINFNKNNENIGVARNILKVVSLSDSKFIWLIGNDDFLLPGSLNHVLRMFNKYRDVDFFYINSLNIDESELKKYSHPLIPSEISMNNLKKFSSYTKSEYLDFFDLIDFKKSFEFLLSMNLVIFRKCYWDLNISEIDKNEILKSGLFSSFDNTAPHSKIWAKAFKDKKAYFLSHALTANVHGPRAIDWGNDYFVFVESFRIPELLDIYRKNGLPLIKYLICKNFAIRKFFPSLIKMIIRPKKSGLSYLNFWRDIIKNLIYPSIYIYGIFYFFKKFLNIIIKTLNYVR
jgi:hypothetical protein